MLDYSIAPNWWITLTQDNKGQWIAMGSRKVNRIDIEARMDDYTWPLSVTDFSMRGPSTIAEYKIGGSVAGFTYTTGTTRLAALGALIDALTKEEEEERKQNEAYARRQEEIQRFGGVVNEELIRKIVKLRKKQAKKAEKEREYDPDGEWDF